jgi:hypothetical protein
VAGTAADARQTADAARNAARTCVLAAGAAADAGEAALPTRAAARTPELAAGAAVSIGVAAAAARIILEDNVRGRTCRGWSGDREVCCGSWGGSDRSGNSPGNN